MDNVSSLSKAKDGKQTGLECQASRSFKNDGVCIGNSTVSRGIWDEYQEWYFKIHQNITSRCSGEWYLGSFEISRAGIYPKCPEETVLFPVYTTRQRNFALYVTGVIFTCKYFKFGLNTTGLSQSHFRNLSVCSINLVIVIVTVVVIIK